MITDLFKQDEIIYSMSDAYEHGFLEPVGKYVLWKIKTAWDDYNELYHAVAFFEKVIKDKTIQIDSHLMIKGTELSGVVFILHGAIRRIETRMQIKDEQKSLLLKYFHIVEKGRGFGKNWLNKVILPYYKSKSFTKIYLASSHPDSFRFYEQFGGAIGEYSSKSDNQLFVRQGKFFMLE
jgi:hypothetical protein